MLFLQILILIGLITLVASFIKSKIGKIGVIGCLTFITILEFSAIYLNGNFIDYRFFKHLNLHSLEAFGTEFYLQIIGIIGLYVFMCIVVFFCSQKLEPHKKLKSINLVIIFIFITVLSLPGGIFNETFKIYQIHTAKTQTFNQALTNLGISPENYVYPSDVKAVKGKNIIVIALESVEQGFLSNEFNNITPNLKQYAKEWTYYDQMPTSPGSNWTAGSLYTHQVGMPAFFDQDNLDSNNIFQESIEARLTGLGHVLNKAGYNSKYLIGNPDFAGKTSILTTYGMDIVSEKNSIGSYQKVKHGIYDHDLFLEAKQQIEVLTDDNKAPFALFMLTLNTHFPGGIFDWRMQKYVQKRDNVIEFSVSAVDYLLHDFIQHLKEKNLFDNTAIFIFPDHLLMGNSGPVIKKLKKRDRQLYLITNVEESDLSKTTDEALYQIDLPKVIIDGAKINTNAKFLADFIKTNNVNEFLNSNKVKLASLNNASLRRTNYQSGINFITSGDRIKVHSNESELTIITNDTFSSQIFDVTFNEAMVEIKQEQIQPDKVTILDENDIKLKRLHLIIHAEKGFITKTYLGNKLNIGIEKTSDPYNFTQAEIQSIMNKNSNLNR